MGVWSAMSACMRCIRVGTRQKTPIFFQMSQNIYILGHEENFNASWKRVYRSLSLTTMPEKQRKQLKVYPAPFALYLEKRERFSQPRGPRFCSHLRWLLRTPWYFLLHLSWLHRILCQGGNEWGGEHPGEVSSSMVPVPHPNCFLSLRFIWWLIQERGLRR